MSAHIAANEKEGQILDIGWIPAASWDSIQFHMGTKLL